MSIKTVKTITPRRNLLAEFSETSQNVRSILKSGRRDPEKFSSFVTKSSGKIYKNQNFSRTKSTATKTPFSQEHKQFFEDLEISKKSIILTEVKDLVVQNVEIQKDIENLVLHEQIALSKTMPTILQDRPKKKIISNEDKLLFEQKWKNLIKDDNESKPKFNSNNEKTLTYTSPIFFNKNNEIITKLGRARSQKKVNLAKGTKTQNFNIILDKIERFKKYRKSVYKSSIQF